ncbi:MAG: DUF192 domain-containing protein [Treponemataceae bacterium]
MKALKFLTCLFFVFNLSLISCSEKLATKDYVIIKTSGEKISISLEIAKTPKEREKGFMWRKNIPEGTGMLFVFDTEEKLSFWMKDTPTALSIAYIDKAGYIKEIYELTPFSKESVKSSFSCLYALEVPQGWFEKQGIVKGARLVLDE